MAMAKRSLPAYSYALTNVTCKDARGKKHDIPDGVYRVGIGTDRVEVLVGGGQCTIPGTEWNRLILAGNVSRHS